MTRLAMQLSLNGHVIADENDYDVALVCIEPASNLLPNKPVIQRLDGIWFKNEHEFQTKNKNIKALYETANHVVWQSDFDSQMTTKHWGKPREGSIIRNGISISKSKTSHSPTFQELRERYEKIFVCSSNWHPQKRLRDNIEMFKHLRSTLFPYSCLIIMGHGPDVHVADKNIYYTGNLPHEVCLELYSVADWMIHLAWADHCPNVVVEAISRGCPVICAETGGTKELVGETNGIIISEKTQYNFELSDYDNPPSIDVTQVSSLPTLIVDASQLDIQLVAKQYEDIFQKFAS